MTETQTPDTSDSRPTDPRWFFDADLAEAELTHSRDCDLTTNRGYACTCTPSYGWTS